METPLTVITERFDDIPLLLVQLQRMAVQTLLDNYFPTHGNWQGLSLGHVSVVWVSHIISQGDRRLSHGADSPALDCVAAVNADGVAGAPSLG